MLSHTVYRSVAPRQSQLDWNGMNWRDVAPLCIDQFHPDSTDHRPVTHAKLSWSDDALHVIFRVLDRYVVCQKREYQGPVCRDSCVEIFLQPEPDRGYFNFEFNCGGEMLLFYIEDPTPQGQSFKRFQPVPREVAREIQVVTSLPPLIEREITDTIEWRLEATIPLSIMRAYVPGVCFGGQSWRANLYKCASESSHPHWASWSNVGSKLSFHQPERFGALNFSAPCRSRETLRNLPKVVNHS